MEFLDRYPVMDDDRERFREAVRLGLDRFDKYREKTGGIGTLSEKTIHAVLKNYFADEEFQEIKVNGFVADALTPDGIFEIQTRNFYTQKRKLEAFLPDYRVCMVYPVRYRRTVSWIDMGTGEISRSRRSPKIDRGYGIFHELYGIKEFIKDSNLSFCIVYLISDEYKYLNGYGEKRKKRAGRADGVPTELVAEVNLCAPEDYLIFIPEELRDVQFGSEALAREAGLHRDTARATLNVLCHLGVIEFTGKSGNEKIYKVSL